MAATVSATLAWRFDDPFIIARVAEYTVAEIALPVEPTTDSAYPLTGQPPPVWKEEATQDKDAFAAWLWDSM
jgi:hypothetical protein